MTFEEFVATRTAVASIEEATGFDLGKEGGGTSGLVYTDKNGTPSLYIEGAPGAWCLTVENYSEVASSEAELKVLEDVLYRYAIAAGYIDAA